MHVCVFMPAHVCMPVAPAHRASTLRVVIFRSVEPEIKIYFCVWQFKLLVFKISTF